MKKKLHTFFICILRSLDVFSLLAATLWVVSIVAIYLISFERIYSCDAVNDVLKMRSAVVLGCSNLSQDVTTIFLS